MSDLANEMCVFEAYTSLLFIVEVNSKTTSKTRDSRVVYGDSIVVYDKGTSALLLPMRRERLAREEGTWCLVIPWIIAFGGYLKSYALGGNLKHGFRNVGCMGPYIGNVAARGNFSHPSGGVEHYGGALSLNLSDASRRNAFHTGDSLMMIEGLDAQDYVGMSLVG
ncbi:hypothetical protein Tco_0421779 [Tanacetum coccineum]